MLEGERSEEKGRNKRNLESFDLEVLVNDTIYTEAEDKGNHQFSGVKKTLDIEFVPVEIFVVWLWRELEICLEPKVEGMEIDSINSSE